MNEHREHVLWQVICAKQKSSKEDANEKPIKHSGDSFAGYNFDRTINNQ